MCDPGERERERKGKKKDIIYRCARVCMLCVYTDVNLLLSVHRGGDLGDLDNRGGGQLSSHGGTRAVLAARRPLGECGGVFMARGDTAGIVRAPSATYGTERAT